MSQLTFHQAPREQDALAANTPSKFTPFMATMPVIRKDRKNEDLAEWVMQTLASTVAHDESLMKANPGPGNFWRVTLAAEPPLVIGNGMLKHGAEMVVSNWGAGVETPVHEHGGGYLFGKVLKGNLLNVRYRKVDETSGIVRQIAADILFDGDLLENGFVDASDPIIHNVRALAPSTSVHFYPGERTTSKYKVEYFEEKCTIGWSDVFPITHERYMDLEVGRVMLVRSSRLPGLGDHFIIITGEPVMKPWGLRPTNDTILAPGMHAKALLDSFKDSADSSYGATEIYGATILQLTFEAERNFKLFHNIPLND